MKKKLHCAYLFADGHAVLVYEKHHRQAGDTRWAEVVGEVRPEDAGSRAASCSTGAAATC